MYERRKLGYEIELVSSICIYDKIVRVVPASCFVRNNQVRHRVPPEQHAFAAFSPGPKKSVEKLKAWF